jgi:hypothetical protein
VIPTTCEGLEDEFWHPEYFQLIVRMSLDKSKRHLFGGRSFHCTKEQVDSLCLGPTGVRSQKLRVAPLGVEKELVVAIAVIVDLERRYRESSVEHKWRPVKLTQKTVLEERHLLPKGVQYW